MQQTPDGTQIYTREELAEAPPEPAFANAPGYARDEEKRSRIDILEEKIAHLTAMLDVTAIDGAKMEAVMNDREIASHLQEGHLFVTDPDPVYMYSWKDFVHASGTMCWQAKAAGWIQVGGDDKECFEHRKEDGSRRVGDVMLFKMRKDIHFLMRQKEEQQRNLRQYGVEASLMDMADRNPGISFSSTAQENGLPSNVQTRMRGNAAAQGARRTAMKHIDGMVREGTVPGMPAYGSNR